MLPLSVGLAALLEPETFWSKRIYWCSIFVIFCNCNRGFIGFVQFLGFNIFGDKFASWFNADPSVIALSSSLLFVAAFMQLSDGISFTGQGTLRGYKDTYAPMYIMISFWCFDILSVTL